MTSFRVCQPEHPQSYCLQFVNELPVYGILLYLLLFLNSQLPPRFPGADRSVFLSAQSRNERFRWLWPSAQQEYRVSCPENLHSLLAGSCHLITVTTREPRPYVEESACLDMLIPKI